MDHGRTTECQSCKRSFSSLVQHLRQSPNCQNSNDSTITDDATSTEQDFEFAKPHVEIKEEFPDQGYMVSFKNIYIHKHILFFAIYFFHF